MIGFEKDRNSLGETQRRTCWVFCDSVPVCVAVDRVRPGTPAVLLAFHYTQTKSSSPLATDTQVQQGFIKRTCSTQSYDCRSVANCRWRRRRRRARRRNVRANTNKENRKAKRVSDGRNSERDTGIVAYC